MSLESAIQKSARYQFQPSGYTMGQRFARIAALIEKAAVMPYTANDPLRGSARGSADAVISWAIAHECTRPDDVRQYIETVYQLAPQLGLNPDIVVAQSIHETTIDGAPWASHWWRTRCNPAGIGITGDPDQNARSRDFGNGVAAARAHLLHLHVYVNGDSVPSGFAIDEDPRWAAAIEAGYSGIARTIADLANRWAQDQDYAEKIARRLNVLAREAFPSAIDIPIQPRRLGPKPYVLLVAGHRSSGDPGDPVERGLTGDLARAYLRAFRAAGYETDWVQEIDNDTDPTMTLGGPTRMMLTCAEILQSRPDTLALLFDLHFNTRDSPVHVIVAHNRHPVRSGELLSTWYAPGRIASDIAPNNTLDMRIAEAIAREIATIPGMRLARAGKSGIAGVMLENETRVGEEGSRLGIMTTTAPLRDKAVRLTIEHGGTNDATQPDFFSRCADASLRAVNTALADRIDTSQGHTPLPEDANEAGGGNIPVLPAFCFGSANGYRFDPNGPVSQLWLRTGTDTGRYPRLIDVLDDGHDKHFLFTDGSIIVASGNDPVAYLTRIS